MAAALHPRRFVHADARLASWTEIEPYFDRLRDRELSDVDALNRWLLDCSELAACIDEVGTDRYVKMTCQTDDEARKRAYLEFIETIEPACKPRWHELDVRYVQCPHTPMLPRDRWAVFDRLVGNRVELFRDENVPLQVEEAKLAQQYQEICGAMTVEYDGREQTLPQLARYLESTDRGVRQQVWTLVARRRLQDADRLESIFDRMIELRGRIAAHAGMDDYRAYAFRARQRFDYTPQDCQTFHRAVEELVVPVYRGIHHRRRERLGVETLRPWDLAVDEDGCDPLRPFTDTDELCRKCSTIFHGLDPELGKQFDALRRADYLNLASRKGKAPGGYQCTYEESRHPFIFMNAVGRQRDVTTLLHESGHAFHALAAAHDPLVAYRSAPLEFAEVASMGMELLATDGLDTFYDDGDLVRAQRVHLQGVIATLPWIATIDAFQHWIYTHPQHGRSERQAHWLELNQRFGGIEDYSGHEDTLERLWHRQLHLFEVPFYYIEYGIAQLGALQVWGNARRDRRAALAAYRRALSLGGSRPLPELFATADIRFDFSAETIRPLIESVQRELEALEC